MIAICSSLGLGGVANLRWHQELVCLCYLEGLQEINIPWYRKKGDKVILDGSNGLTSKWIAKKSLCL
jgi:hypothetical protein